MRTSGRRRSRNNWPRTSSAGRRPRPSSSWPFPSTADGSCSPPSGSSARSRSFRGCPSASSRPGSRIAAAGGGGGAVRPPARGEGGAAVSRLSESTIFMMVDAIGERRGGDALRYLDDILREEASPYVLFMVARQCRLLMRASHLTARGKPFAVVQDALGVPPFVARKII